MMLPTATNIAAALIALSQQKSHTGRLRPIRSSFRRTAPQSAPGWRQVAGRLRTSPICGLGHEPQSMKAATASSWPAESGPAIRSSERWKCRAMPAWDTSSCAGLMTRCSAATRSRASLLDAPAPPACTRIVAIAPTEPRGGVLSSARYRQHDQEYSDQQTYRVSHGP